MTNAVARLYRETLKRCRHLGGERGLAARLDAKSFYQRFREPGSDAEPLLEAARSRLSYLRMVTPRFHGGRRLGSMGEGMARNSEGKSTFVIRGGVLQVCAGRPPHLCTSARSLTPDEHTIHRRCRSLVSNAWSRRPFAIGEKGMWTLTW